MSDPTRLLDEPSASPALQELLGSARNDGPSADDLARLAKRLGPLLVATAPVSAAAATSAASSAAATTKAAAATAVGTQVAAGAGVLKLTVIAAVGGTVIAAGSFQAGRSYEATRPPPPPKVERVVVASPPPVAQLVVEEPVVAEPEPAPVPEDAPRVAKPSPRPVQKAPEPKLTEVELLEKAMAAMKAGDAKGALALTARHQSEFQGGALVQEREMLSIEALLKLGKLPEARLKGEDFRKRYPTSSHLLRLDALLK
jgi:hypothetical protein